MAATAAFAHTFDISALKIPNSMPLTDAASHFREFSLDLSSLLSALNKEVQLNALLPTGLGPNSPPRADPTVDPTIAAARIAAPGLTIQPQTSQPPTIHSPTPPVAPEVDVYHSSGAPTSPSLLAQSGVKAYVQLVNALSAAGHSEKSAEVLTHTLLVSSAALKSAYQDAVAKLPLPLQSKDWRFSVANGSLVFAPGNDDLTVEDLTLLRTAFASSDVEPPANELASAITTMESQRSAGADLGSLAWGRLRVDDTNFEQVVDLRSYLTATAPGSRYSANTANPDLSFNPATGANPAADSSSLFNTNTGSAQIDPSATARGDVPLMLGGMYLGDLVTARPDFFQPSVPAKTDVLQDAGSFAHPEASAILHGRCSCGEVCFTVENTLEYAFYCHCSRCRLRTGSAFAAIGGASIEKLHVTAGNRLLLIEGECSDGYGARCSRCYAFLFAAVRARQYVHVSLGTLAGVPGRLPDHHIYVASKASWYQISDSLPQYDELP